MKQCPIQHICTQYNSGDNKPPNHDVRTHYPCVHFTNSTCNEWLDEAYKNGDTIACNLKKRKEALENIGK